FTISPTGHMTRPGPGTVVNGASQTTNIGNTNPNGPEIVISGLSNSAFLRDGLRITDAGVTVRGLTFNNFPQCGILFEGPTCTGSTVAGCYIGMDHNAAGSAPNGRYGVIFQDGASGNTLGGT